MASWFWLIVGGGANLEVCGNVWLLRLLSGIVAGCCRGTPPDVGSGSEGVSGEKELGVLFPEPLPPFIAAEAELTTTDGLFTAEVSLF